MAPNATPLNNRSGDTLSAAALGLEFDLGSFFLDEDEKNDAIAEGTEFYITAIDYDEKNKYGPRFTLTVEATDAETPTPRGWAMAADNVKRNGIIESIMNAMSQQGAARVGPVVFRRRGNSIDPETGKPRGTVMFFPVEQDLPF